MLEAILETRQLAPEIIAGVELLLEEDTAVSKEQAQQLIVQLLGAHELEDAPYHVGGIIEG